MLCFLVDDSLKKEKKEIRSVDNTEHVAEKKVVRGSHCARLMLHRKKHLLGAVSL